MKQDTFVLVLKGSCYIIVGAFTPWTAALAQWANEGSWPPKIIWMGVILPTSLVGAASALLSFLSSSYSNYAKKQDTGNTQIITKTP